ncbi:MAG: hypothetical protein WAK55_20340 [Xanthobacteraceae bacterium]
MGAVICYSEAMKTGDKAFVRLDGVVYEGTVKRAFLSPFGVPSVWIEWPKDINPRPIPSFPIL